MKKTTVKHFELFKHEAKVWVNALGLREYELHFHHDELEDSLAQCGSNEQARLGMIYLNKEWHGEVPLNNLEIKKAACHEVLELFLSRLRAYADCKNGTPELVDGEIHRVIQVLINNFYDC